MMVRPQPANQARLPSSGGCGHAVPGAARGATGSRLNAPRKSPSQALVEFAFVLPATLLFLLGMIDFSRAYSLGVAVQEGARQATRYGAEAGIISSITDDLIRQRLILASSPALDGCSNTSTTCTNGFGTWTFTITPAAKTRGSTLVVTANGSVPLMTGFLLRYLGAGSISIQGQATMVIL